MTMLDRWWGIHNYEKYLFELIFGGVSQLELSIDATRSQQGMIQLFHVVGRHEEQTALLTGNSIQCV
jgi:hypothetical protein